MPSNNPNPDTPTTTLIQETRRLTIVTLLLMIATLLHTVVAGVSLLHDLGVI